MTITGLLTGVVNTVDTSGGTATPLETTTDGEQTEAGAVVAVQATKGPIRGGSKEDVVTTSGAKKKIQVELLKIKIRSRRVRINR